MHCFKTLSTVRWLLQLLSLMLMFTEFSAAAIAKVCPPNYVRRTVWMTKKISKEVCCRFIQCNPGYFVRKCEEDFGRDRCEQCEEKSFLLDKTNSTNPHLCPKFECPAHMRQVNYFPLGSCHLPCLCNTEKGYYLKKENPNHCNCLLHDGACAAWQVLSLYGKCVSPREANMILEETKPRNPVTFPPYFVNPHEAENSKSKNTDSKSSLSTTSCILISMVLVAAFIALVAVVYFKVYRQKNEMANGPERVVLPVVKPIANVQPHTRSENKVSNTVTISNQTPSVNHYLTAPASLDPSHTSSHVETEVESPSVPNNPGTWPSPDTEQPLNLNYVDLSPCHLYQSIRRQQPIDGSPDTAASQPLLHNVEHLYPSLPPSTNLLFSRGSSQDSEIDDDNTNVKSTS